MLIVANVLIRSSIIAQGLLKSLVGGAVVLGGVFAIGTGTASADTYTVQSGDTLSKIADNHKTTVESILSQNAIANENLIYVGETFEIGEIATPETVTTPQVVEVQTPVVEQVEQPVVKQEAPTQQATGRSAKEIIAQRESSGSYEATNGKYIGRYQLDASYLNGDYSPANQERVANDYTASRYGSWDNALAFWNANGWY